MLNISVRNCRGVALFAALSLMVSLVFAGESASAWQPPPPMPDDFDWVQLTSGEWLKGEIIAMYEETLEFDSDKLKVLSLKWKDVVELRSAGPMVIGFEDGEIVMGRVLIEQETIQFVGGEGRHFPRSEILSINAGTPREIDHWAIKASLGANLRQGNSEQVEATTRAAFIRRAAMNRVNFEYLASFNSIDGVKAADSHRLTTGWNRFVSKRVFWTPLFGEWHRDPFQNIANKWSAGAGFGYELIDTSEMTWQVEAGLSYQETRFDSVAEDVPATVSTPGLVLSTSFDADLTAWMDFKIDWRFNFVNDESGTYTHHMITGLEFELTRLFDLNLSLIWDRIQNPQDDSEGVVPLQDDYRFVTFLGFEF